MLDFESVLLLQEEKSVTIVVDFCHYATTIIIHVYYKETNFLQVS